MTAEERSAREAIKSRLSKYTHLARERRQLEAELERLERYKGSLKSQNLDGMPRGSTGSDPTAREAVDNVDLAAEYTERLLAIAQEQVRLEQLIEPLSATERTLMRYRYTMGLRWEEVCEEMSYSWRQTHRIHSMALSQLAAREMKGEET